MIITIRNLQKTVPVRPRKVRAIIRKIFVAEAGARNGEICVSFISDAAIRRLNLRYHGRDAATDVLAFDLSPSRRALVADICVSAPTARRNAKEFKTTPAGELMRYVIHGMLHLVGYGDRTARARALMRAKEQFYLEAIKGT